MRLARKRFWLYIAVGLSFGIIDWFYLNGLAGFPWGSFGQSVLVVPVILALNYGIWLVPILPVAWIEARKTDRVLPPMLAGAATWVSAMVSYYGFYAVLLSLGRLPNLQHLSLVGEKPISFWPEYWQMFHRIITNQFFEWSLIALAGGAVIGSLAYWGQHRLLRRASKEGSHIHAGYRSHSD